MTVTSSLSQNTALLVAGALAGYAIMMRTNPVRESLRDGWLAIRRYPFIWVCIGFLGFAHAVFELGIRAYLGRMLPHEERPAFQWVREAWRDPNLWLTGSPGSLWWLPSEEVTRTARESFYPAIESLAGLFHNLTTTFPISAVVALVFLMPWRERSRVLRRGLRRRFGTFAWVIYAALSLTAMASIAKPFVYASPEVLPPLLWTHWGQVVVSVAFAFEYLLGVGIQVFLILMAFAWIRGLTFHREALIEVAIRRFVVVLPWSAIVLLLTFLSIDLPLILKNFPATAAYFVETEIFDYWLGIARAFLTLIILLSAGVQVRLALHSSSWRQAMREHFLMMGRAWWPFAWFVIVAFFHYFVWIAVRQNISSGVGEGTALWIAWSLLSPWIAGVIGAWLLASWVCVYRRYVRPTASVSPMEAQPA